MKQHAKRRIGIGLGALVVLIAVAVVLYPIWLEWILEDRLTAATGRSVEKGDIAATAAAVASLAALVNPMAALIPLMEMGDAKAVHCQELLARARGSE